MPGKPFDGVWRHLGAQALARQHRTPAGAVGVRTARNSLGPRRSSAKPSGKTRDVRLRREPEVI